MKNIKALLKLDFRLFSPYWYWWLMFFGISLVLGLVNQNGTNIMISLPIFAATMTAFPFESGEKSNINMLYAILPTNRKSMVAARYISIGIILLLSLAVGLGVGAIIDVAFGNIGTMYHMVMLVSLAIAFAMFAICAGFQTPFFYKMGYKKGRIFMWLPIIIIMLIQLLPLIAGWAGADTNRFYPEYPYPNPYFREFNVFNLMFRTPLATGLIALGIGLVALVVSYFASYKIYTKKDL